MSVVEKVFSDEALAAAWAHPELMKIWGIVSFPDFQDGEAILKKGDIELITKAVVELNEVFNHPKIQALLTHLGADYAK